MAKKKAQTWSPEEAKKALVEKREALRQFRFQASGSKVKNVKHGKVLKREIARILTSINSVKVVK